MPQKKHYYIRNWKDYNKALVNRGSVTVWFDKNNISKWYNETPSKTRGRPKLYADLAIQCCLIIKAVFHMPLRATQGFVNSLFELMKLKNITAPDYTLLSLRQKNLKLTIPKRKSAKEPLHLVFDSTGIKLYGEGEWKMRKHGKSKRRSWLKLHLAVDEKTHNIEASLLTEVGVHDAEALPNILSQVNDKIEQITGDGAYDTHCCYEAAINVEAKPCFPPRCNAAQHKPTDAAWQLRNKAVSDVKRSGLASWKEENNYHRRSLSETAMFRFKQLLGDKVMARTFERQAIEIGIKCMIINKMNQLGMPDYS